MGRVLIENNISVCLIAWEKCCGQAARPVSGLTTACQQEAGHSSGDTAACCQHDSVGAQGLCVLEAEGALVWHSSTGTRSPAFPTPH